MTDCFQVKAHHLQLAVRRSLVLQRRRSVTRFLSDSRMCLQTLVVKAVMSVYRVTVVKFRNRHQSYYWAQR